METIALENAHAWLSFEDFRAKVCQADWYKPGGQMVAIDTATGNWAAMSAITRYESSDHATNLHTGVDKRYHGRKLAQAIIVQALRYARQELKVNCVHSDENAQNLTTIAMYRELGYKQTHGIYASNRLAFRKRIIP